MLHPAPAGSGVRFRRLDLAGSPEVPVAPASLESGVRCTALRYGETRVRTVEHLLATTWALGVDNLLVELDAEELPILDGSAAPWLAAIDEAGRLAQDVPVETLAIERPLLYSQGETHLMVVPGPSLRLTVASVTSHPVAGCQMIDMIVSPSEFRGRLAIARTFCYLEEVETLLAAGLARGGSLDNALVVRPDGYSSPLRMENELAAHKALDLLGDLAVLGGRLCAHVIAVRPGHHANQQLVRMVWDHCNPHASSIDQNASGGALPDGDGAVPPRPVSVG
jgi:UDP-3-O-acyl N-acetylglucosamine deacetylase